MNTNSKPQGRVRELIFTLGQFYPDAFRLPPRPLKIGIHEDVIMTLDNWTFEMTSAALTYWTGQDAYLRTLVAGAPRFDLWGQPCGFVSEDNARFARECLQARRKAPSAASVTEDQYRRFRALLIGDGNG